MRLRSKQDIRAEIDRAFGAWEAEFGYSIEKRSCAIRHARGWLRLARVGSGRMAEHQRSMDVATSLGKEALFAFMKNEWS